VRLGDPVLGTVKQVVGVADTTRSHGVDMGIGKLVMEGHGGVTARLVGPDSDVGGKMCGRDESACKCKRLKLL
jgi:hypothetical protein